MGNRNSVRQSDLDGIKHCGAKARERGVSYFGNPLHLDADDVWLVTTTAWSIGWREADAGRDAALAALDRVPYW